MSWIILCSHVVSWSSAFQLRQPKGKTKTTVETFKTDVAAPRLHLVWAALATTTLSFGFPSCSVCYFDSRVDFASSNQPLLGVGCNGITHVLYVCCCRCLHIKIPFDIRAVLCTGHLIRTSSVVTGYHPMYTQLISTFF